MGEQIFISYKRVNKERVMELKNLIEQTTGARCWIDLDGIESNAQFAAKIMSAIDNCQVFIFMRSEVHHSIANLETDWTIREVNYALEEKKNIVIINLDNTPMPKWFKFMFPNKQEIDANNPAMLDRLCADLQLWLTSGEAALPQEQTTIQQATNLKQTTQATTSVVSTNPTTIQANHTKTCVADNFVFELDPINLTATLAQLKGKHQDGKPIPEHVTFEGVDYSVDNIGNSAFANKLTLKTITIPPSITKINVGAFHGCTNLTSITLHDNITTIGGRAFEGCQNIETITLPNALKEIKPDLFKGCERLHAIVIPKNVTSIGKGAFHACSSLTTVTFNSKLKKIETEAFANCNSLTTIALPNSITRIDDNAFKGTSLKEIIIPAGSKKRFKAMHGITWLLSFKLVEQ